MIKTFKFLKQLKKIKFNLFNSFLYTTKDDKFWEDYSKRKAQGGKYPALESQEIIYNKTIHSWKYSSNHALTSDELIDCFKELKKNEDTSYILVDIREDSELELYKLPDKTKVKYNSNKYRKE
jgi:hypothetical protein